MNRPNLFAPTSLIAAGVVLLASALGADSANAQVSATVDVDVNLPEILVVRYVNQVTFNPAITDLGTSLTSTGLADTVTVTGATSDGFAVTAAEGTPTTGLSPNGQYTGTVANALAVWTNAAQFEVTSLATSATLTGPSGTGEIDLSAPDFTGITETGERGQNLFFPLTFANAAVGDLTFTLDLSDAVESGLYSSGTGSSDITYTVATL